jgi:hypothetical protein
MEVDENPITDSSQNTNTGALKGAGEPNYATADPPDSGDGFGGTSVGYYVFDGSDDDIDCGTDTSLDFETVDFTLCAWVNLDQSPGDKGDSMAIVGRWGPTSQNRTYLLIATDDVFKFETSGLGGALELLGADTTFPSAVVGNWTHVCGTYGVDDKIIYINGNNEGEDNSIAATLDSSSEYFGIGMLDSGQLRPFDGRIDEVAAFSEELSGTDINDILDNGLTGAAVAARRIIMLTKKE